MTTTDNFNFKNLQDAGKDIFSGKRILLRLDLNVPVRNASVANGFRIEQSIETVDFLRKAGSKIIVVAHLENKEYNSLDIVCKYSEKYFPTIFIKDPWSAEGQTILRNLRGGEVAIIENIRNWPGEKKNDDAFSKKLSELADIYVNEAFSVSHRSHASIVGVPKFLPSFAGFNFIKEVANLSHAFSPPSPYLFVLGGAKIETKAPLIEKFLGIADHVFVGGALATDLFKAKGFDIGHSLFSNQNFDFSKILNNPKLILPFDVVVESNLEKKVVKNINQVSDGEKIWDCGPQTILKLSELIKEAKFILWNGPLGVFENGYTEGTFALAKAIALVGRQDGVESVVGGGDTLASIEILDLADKFTFISTGGGAMLDFLVDGTLPGIKALEVSK